MKNLKTKHERIIEVVNIKKQLRNLDIEDYIKENIPEIENEIRTFIEKGESYSAKYLLKEFNRILILVLTNSKTSYIQLKYRN